MIELDNMEWGHYNTIKKKVLRELITELEGLEYPPDWKPKDVFRLIIRKLEDKERSC